MEVFVVNGTYKCWDSQYTIVKKIAVFSSEELAQKYVKLAKAESVENDRYVNTWFEIRKVQPDTNESWTL